ncbi:MAG: hypothetical protein M1839_003859 [Geoglossum umbratile]|nr:MAG: hypothetical protein M1839_003859 [Geoglossum umbratile]
MKNPLAAFVIATSGSFGAAKRTDINRWVEKAGGVCAANIDKHTTHLVCSWEDYQAKVPKVKQALKNGRIHIVTYDWLEDALQKRRAAKARGKYLLANVEKQKRREEKLVMRGIKKVDKKIRKGLKKDARYRRPGASAIEVLAPVGSYFDEAFAQFRRRFLRETGVLWEDRLDAVPADAGPVPEGRYSYRPPPAGGKKARGRGVLPEGKVVVVAAAAAAVVKEEEEEEGGSEGGDQSAGEDEEDEDEDEDDDDDAVGAVASAAGKTSGFYAWRENFVTY